MFFLNRRHHPKHHHPPKPPAPEKLISLLVPYLSQGDLSRDKVWNWLYEFWKENLPDCEIILGEDKEGRKKWYRRKIIPFSKTSAVNNAFRRSHGDIIVILDADAYFHPAIVVHCAERLRAAREVGIRTWFVPYQHLYRLTQEATKLVLESLPRNPLWFSSPPPPSDVEGQEGSGDGGPSLHGRHYGAMCQIMPREAFEAAGHMDSGFRGWGGEDVAFLRALDTLWGKHKNTPNDILHLWHHRKIAGEWADPNKKVWEVRVWAGQKKSRVNDHLTVRYNKATGNVEKMQALVDENPIEED